MRVALDPLIGYSKLLSLDASKLKEYKVENDIVRVIDETDSSLSDGKYARSVKLWPRLASEENEPRRTFSGSREVAHTVNTAHIWGVGCPRL
jgi:hypothetical protein